MILYIKMSPWLAGDLKQTRLDQTRHCLVGHNVRKKYLYENRQSLQTPVCRENCICRYFLIDKIIKCYKMKLNITR